MSTAPHIASEDYLAISRLYSEYALAVDSGDWDLWPEFFTEDCTYKLVPRENHDEARRENLSEQRAINLRDQNYIN